MLRLAESRRGRLIAGALWLGALVWLLTTWSGHYPIDLDVYRLGGLAWLAGEPLYVGFTGPPLDPQLPFTYPPIAAVLFSGLAFLPEGSQNPLMVAFGFVALTAVCVAVAGKVRPGLKWTVGPLAAIVALALEPVWMTYGYGQVNLFLLAMVVIDCLVVTDRRFRGVLIGIAAAIKLTPAIFVLYFLARREWRAAITSMVTFAGLAVAGFLITPRDSAQYWLHSLLNPDRIGDMSLSTNQSIRGVLRGLGLPPGIETLLWASLAAAVVAVAIFLARRTNDDLVALFTIAAAGLLASPVSWVHHWVWCVPVLVYLAVRGNAWPAFAAVFLVFVTRLHAFDTFVWLTIVSLGLLAARPPGRQAARHASLSANRRTLRPSSRSAAG
ncbi:glycosyltransferase 87 family protein [Lentzea sp. BCCO 10_0856]|uniref:Glycosyltransferase 87 family protein n=1 Tax=Lentzea miocenica TaxID=3095431 RepID=A0ABU4TBI8_9PSEU|nr:glycosyltransferase 87 family protein [Lentzea sp. BCCO 10_0856]MDX8035288.1 glycosyltransferase 87 family protein [Lentzea sp. BCCO 10_0856]